MKGFFVIIEWLLGFQISIYLIKYRNEPFNKCNNFNDKNQIVIVIVVLINQSFLIN